MNDRRSRTKLAAHEMQKIVNATVNVTSSAMKKSPIFLHLPSSSNYRHYNEFDGRTAFEGAHETHAIGNETHIDMLKA